MSEVERRTEEQPEEPQTPAAPEPKGEETPQAEAGTDQKEEKKAPPKPGATEEQVVEVPPPPPPDELPEDAAELVEGIIDDMTAG